MATVTYEKEIVNHASKIINETKCIWSKTRDDVYTVVREFNMTKGNVFPNEMLSNPKKAICMFVKKGGDYKSWDIENKFQSREKFWGFW